MNTISFMDINRNINPKREMTNVCNYCGQNFDFFLRISIVYSRVIFFCIYMMGYVTQSSHPDRRAVAVYLQLLEVYLQLLEIC
jgi:hypothetical protein